MPRLRRRRDNSADFGGKHRTDPLVCIDFEDPVATAGIDPGVAPRPFPLPGALDDSVGELPRDVARPVAATVEHDDDLVGKPKTGEAIGELSLFVMRDYE